MKLQFMLSITISFIFLTIICISNNSFAIENNNDDNNNKFNIIADSRCRLFSNSSRQY